MKYYTISSLIGTGNQGYFDSATGENYSSTGESFVIGDENSLQLNGDNNSSLSVHDIVNGELIGLNISKSGLYSNNPKRDIILVIGGSGENAKAEVTETKVVRLMDKEIVPDEELAEKILDNLQGWILDTDKSDKKMGETVTRINLKSVLRAFEAGVAYVESDIRVYENDVPIESEHIFYEAVYKIAAASLWDKNNPSVIVQTMLEGKKLSTRGVRLMEHALEMLGSITFLKVSGLRDINRQSLRQSRY